MTQAWWYTESDRGAPEYLADDLDDDLQIAHDQLSHPDPQLIVRTVYNNRPDLDRKLYWALEQRARRKWWPHLIDSRFTAI